MRRISIGLLMMMACVAAATQARADEESEFRTELKRIQEEMRELSVEVIQFKLAPRYCLPPNAPLKQPHQMVMDGYNARAKALNDRYVATIASIVAFFKTNTALRQDLLLQDGIDRADQKYWDGLNFNVGRQRMNATVANKQAELDGKRERDCKPASNTGTTGIIGTPPVQPPPPPPPPPPAAPPVDPMAGLSPPKYEAVNMPQLADRYCSQLEMNTDLGKIDTEIAKARAHIKETEHHIADLLQRRAELEKRGVEAHWLRSMDYKVREAEFLIDSRNSTIKALETSRSLIRSTPIVDCSTGKDEIGSLPGGTSVGVAGGVGMIHIPKRLYIALENAGELRLGAADTKRRETIAALFLTMMYDLDFLPKTNLAKIFGLGQSRSQTTRLTGELETYVVTLQSSGGSIITTTEGVGIPGTGDPSHPSPAGYFLNNPTFNDVMDISQRFATSYDGLHIAIEQEESCEGMSGSLAIGGRFGRLETSDRFSGSIPGFARDFAYQTDLETAIWGLFVATEAELSLDDAWDRNLRYAGEFSGFRVSAGARAGVNFVSADGTDRLDFTGFAPQSVRLSKDDTTFSYQLKVGLHYTPPTAPGLDISISAAYNQDGIHNSTHRSGETGDSSQVKIEDQEMYYGAIRTTFTF